MPLPQVQALKDMLARSPGLMSALMGAGVGAATGAAFSDPGESGRGALQGALLGGVTGGVGGGMTHRLTKAVPSPEAAAASSALLSGTFGGYLGRRKTSPWVLEHLRSIVGNDKEASVDNTQINNLDPHLAASAKEGIEKKAALEKEAADRTLAFDFGMEYFLKEKGVDKNEFAKKAGLEDGNKLAEATIAWASEQTQEQPAAAAK